MKTPRVITVWAVWIVTAFSSSVWADCSAISGSDPILEPGTVVLLGEIHGTRQAPDAVSRLTCTALEHGRRVTVGLEIPQQDEDVIHGYIVSDDEVHQRSLLLSASFWQRDYQDGRSSRAMLDLLSELRAYARTTERVRVVAIDHPEAPNGRDAHMAHRLSDEISSATDDVFIVLVGNLHNRLVTGTRWNASYEPMGYLLQTMGVDAELVSLRLTHSGGSAWICTGGAPSDCGERELNGNEGLTLGVEILEESTPSPYSGRLHLGRIDASPPAKLAQ